MLDHLDSGNWELRFRDAKADTQRICLDNGRKLIQLRHNSLRCSSIIVEDRETEITVQYTCPGQGYGRTTIRWESSRLVQVQSQGIAEGLPFAFTAEARRIGACGG